MIRLMYTHRARVVLVAVVAAILVVGSVIVTAVRRSQDSRATVCAGAAAGATETVRLRFQPVPGTRRTVRVVTTTTVSKEGDAPEDSMTTIESLVFDLEAREPAEDGTAAIDVNMTSIHVTLIMAGQVSAVYDSTKPPAEENEFAKSCSALVTNRFTIRVSPKGEVVDPGLAGLFLAAAENRAKEQDDALRKEFNEKSGQAMTRQLEGLSPSQADSLREAVKKGTDHFIEVIHAQSDWRKNRVSELNESMEQSPVLGREGVSSLVNGLMAALPNEVVRVGDAWKGSLVSQADMFPPIPGMYTLTAIEPNVCTIQALGQRGLDEDPVVKKDEGWLKTTSRLGGSSEATLQIERQTGWLLRREQKTNLHGVFTTTIARPQPRDISDQTSIEITRVLTVIK